MTVSRVFHGFIDRVERRGVSRPRGFNYRDRESFARESRRSNEMAGENKRRD